MRRKDRELTEIRDLEEILNQSYICHLGLVDGDQPYVVPLNFVYAEGSIFVHSASQGYKLDLIKKNSKVCFEVVVSTGDAIKNGDQPCDWGTAFRSVIGFGTAHLLSEPEDKKKALKAIVGRFDSRDLSFNDHDFNVTTVIRVDITGMTGKAANV
jgi:hypothetical protein